jgi:hypothetical protein
VYGNDAINRCTTKIDCGSDLIQDYTERDVNTGNSWISGSTKNRCSYISGDPRLVGCVQHPRLRGFKKGQFIKNLVGQSVPGRPRRCKFRYDLMKRENNADGELQDIKLRSASRIFAYGNSDSADVKQIVTEDENGVKTVVNGSLPNIIGAGYVMYKINTDDDTMNN